MEFEPGECIIIGFGLLSGELCCVMGEDAEGDIMGDCGVLPNGDEDGCANGELAFISSGD